MTSAKLVFLANNHIRPSFSNNVSSHHDNLPFSLSLTDKMEKDISSPFASHSKIILITQIQFNKHVHHAP